MPDTVPSSACLSAGLLPRDRRTQHAPRLKRVSAPAVLPLAHYCGKYWTSAWQVAGRPAALAAVCRLAVPDAFTGRTLTGFGFFAGFLTRCEG